MQPNPAMQHQASPPHTPGALPASGASLPRQGRADSWRRFWRGWGDLPRDKADTLTLLLACALVLAPHTAHLPLWVSLVCAATLLWRGHITFSGKRMPSLWLLVPLAGLAMAAVQFSFRAVIGRDAGVAMLALLITFKLLEMHAKRDLYVVVFLSFFIILTNFFFSQSIPTALMMVAAVVFMLTALLSFQYTGRVPPFRQRLRLAAQIFGMAVPLTLVLFIVFPRVQGPLWGLPGEAGGARSGLSDSMAPSNISSLAMSDEIAFRVKFEGPPPKPAQLYWRGPVLGLYDGRTWSALPPRRHLQGKPMTVKTEGAALRHQVTLEPHGQRWLFALELPAAPPEIEGNPAGISPDLQLTARQPINSRLRYEVESNLNFTAQSDERPAAMRHWLALPAGFDPRTLAFAKALRAQAPEPTDQVAAVLKHFRREPFRYTLEPPLLGEDAVDEFLFNTKAGFCEHYSSAFVVLMRAMGTPARVVTGYQGGEMNPVDGFMSVRQSDAHAWAEVWVAGNGWLRVDPTAAVAPERVERNLASALPPNRALGTLVAGLTGGLITLQAGRSPWLTALRNNWSAVTNSWNQWVLDYTPQRQRGLLQSLGLKNVDWGTLALLTLLFGGAAVAVVAVPLVRNRPQIDPVDALYRKLCQRMAQRGHPKQPHEPPQTYGARLNAALAGPQPELAQALARFFQLLVAVKYGRAWTPKPPLSELKALLGRCR